MSEGSTDVTIGDSQFNLAGIGGWIESHIWIVLLIAAVAFIFYIFQPGGFAEKLLEHRQRRRELEARQISDLKAIADIFRRRHGDVEPLLPFDDFVNPDHD